MKILRKNWRIALAYIAIFLVLSFLIGGSIGPQDAGRYKPVKLNVAVSVPEEGHLEGEAFAVWLERSGHDVQRVSFSERDARETVFSEAHDAVFLFADEGVGVEVITDQKSANVYYSLSVAETYFRYLNTFRLADGSYERESLDLVLSQEMAVSVQLRQQATNGNSESLIAFLSSFAYILMLLSTTLIPLLNESFAQPGVRIRTAIAPYPLRFRAIQMILGAGIIVFGAAAFLSGAFVPQSMLSESVLNLSRVFPLYYFIHANRFLSSFADMAPDLIAQACFAGGYFILGIMIARFMKRSRRQLAT